MASSCGCRCGGNSTNKTISGTVSSTAALHGRIYAPTFVSAYSIAVKNGFKGTEEEWLESLKGADGKDGASAYEVAVENGFEGTEEEWLDSLVGPVGPQGEQGISAYQVAVNNGFVGTEEEWLESLHGKDGKDGVTRHNDLEGRDEENCHPIKAITNLDNTLSDIREDMDSKLDEVPSMSIQDILDICK